MRKPTPAEVYGQRLRRPAKPKKPMATLERTRAEVPSRSRGRPSYRWVAAVYVIRPDGTKEYPPVRLREAWARCRAEGWIYRYTG